MLLVLGVLLVRMNFGTGSARTITALGAGPGSGQRRRVVPQQVCLSLCARTHIGIGTVRDGTNKYESRASEINGAKNPKEIEKKRCNNYSMQLGSIHRRDGGAGGDGKCRESPIGQTPFAKNKT